MSFLSALVDRGRKVETRIGHRDPNLGESETIVQRGEWYKVRLNPPDSQENRPANEAAEHRLQTEILLPKDFDLNLNDRIEIDSAQLGRATWIVTAQPQFLRRKRSVIGQTATVLKVEDV